MAVGHICSVRHFAIRFEYQPRGALNGFPMKVGADFQLSAFIKISESIIKKEDVHGKR